MLIQRAQKMTLILTSQMTFHLHRIIQEEMKRIMIKTLNLLTFLVLVLMTHLKLALKLRRKKNKILQAKTGSAKPVKVNFNKFEFSNSYIWFEFYNAPLENDTFRSWHIVGRLGGCNSMNMQLSQSTFEKRPNYDAIQGANVTPSTFYNIGDFEIQDNLARVWVDIGTTEPLLLDTLINALTQISSDYVGIKQLVFGGSEFENWKENLTSEYAGYSVHKI
uniref:Uncharacterized protein n=1 Tax=Salix viminalis TaxID=40686 RepID=A0A6N2MA18_SALVM